MKERHYLFVKGAIWQHVDSRWGLNEVLHVLRERMPDTCLKDVFIRHVFSAGHDYDVWLVCNRPITQHEFAQIYQYFVVDKIDYFRSW